MLLGTHDIFIGVKGDCDLNNTVNALDAQHTLSYFLEHGLLDNEGYRIDGYVDEDSQELLDRYGDLLGGEDGLIFYLVNVAYKENPLEIKAIDAQLILRYFLENTVMDNPMNWDDEELVGYDLNLDTGFDWDESNSDR